MVTIFVHSFHGQHIIIMLYAEEHDEPSFVDDFLFMGSEFDLLGYIYND